MRGSRIENLCSERAPIRERSGLAKKAAIKMDGPLRLNEIIEDIVVGSPADGFFSKCRTPRFLSGPPYPPR